MKLFIKTFCSISLLVLFGTLLIYSQNAVEFESVQLFEGGDEPDPLGYRTFETHFVKGETKYVYYEIKLKNYLYNNRNNEVSIRAEYYDPYGKLIGAPVLNYTIPPDWEYVDLWNGWGWEDKEDWTAGTYRIVIYIGDKKITQVLFSIYFKYWLN